MYRHIKRDKRESEKKRETEKRDRDTKRQGQRNKKTNAERII